MSEVFEIVSEMILLSGLFLIAWGDYKTKMIKTKWLWILGLAGGGCRLLQAGSLDVKEVFLGSMSGVILLFLAKVTKECIGFGDGWLFCVTGIFLGFFKNVVLLSGSMLLAGIYAVFCLLLKKRGKNDRLAFVPFVFTAYVVFIL